MMQLLQLPDARSRAPPGDPDGRPAVRSKLARSRVERAGAKKANRPLVVAAPKVPAMTGVPFLAGRN